MNTIQKSAIFALAVAASTNAYSKCDVSVNKYEGVQVPLVPLAVHLKDSPLSLLTISGLIVPKDGCSFTVKNFTAYPLPAQTFWYGTKKGSGDAYRISEAAVTSSQSQDVTFTLTTVPGREVSWNDIDTIRIYSEQTKELLGQANLGGDDKAASTSGSAKTMALSGLGLVATALFGALFL